MTIPDIASASGIGHALASWLTKEEVMLETPMTISLAEKLDQLANRARLIQMACDGLEETEDGNTIIAQEAYKLYLALRDLSDEVGSSKKGGE